MNRFFVDEKKGWKEEELMSFDWYLGVQTMLLTCKTNCNVNWIKISFLSFSKLQENIFKQMLSFSRRKFFPFPIFQRKKMKAIKLRQVSNFRMEINS